MVPQQGSREAPEQAHRGHFWIRVCTLYSLLVGLLSGVKGRIGLVEPGFVVWLVVEQVEEVFKGDRQESSSPAAAPE